MVVYWRAATGKTSMEAAISSTYTSLWDMMPLENGKGHDNSLRASSTFLSVTTFDPKKSLIKAADALKASAFLN